MIKISNYKESDIFFIQVEGEVDASSSIHLDEAINDAISAGAKKLLIDLNGLNYISSAGLGVINTYIQDFDSEGVRLVLYGLSDKVRKVFEIIGLDQFLQIADTKLNAMSLVHEF